MPTSVSEIPYSSARRELGIDGEVKPGDRGQQVRKVQEWLCLAGLHLAIDGVCGPATEATIRRFQSAAGLPDTGVADQATFDSLTQPMRRALARVPAPGPSLGETVVACAAQHLAEYPLEVGGQNCGPWVRLYLQGNQGSNWPWCAGFVSFVVRQAADNLGVKMPFKTTFSCDILAAQAQAAGRFVSERDLAQGRVAKADLPPGSIFVNRKTANDWDHTGIVTAFHGDHFETIEGNTNDDGDREGYEVCRRTRGYGNRDFILLG